MPSLRLYRLVGFAFPLLFMLGVLVLLFVRPPAETASGPMLDGVDLTGQVRKTVADMTHAVKQVADIRPATSTEEIGRRRSQVVAVDLAAERLQQELAGVESSWVPVAEATLLLTDCRELGKTALARSPSRQVPERDAAAAGPLETDPNKTGLTEETEQALKQRAEQLLEASQRLRLRVHQAVAGASFARGTLLGYQASDLLLALLGLAALLGGTTAWQSLRNLRHPPEKEVQLRLQVMARRDPRAALTKCHENVNDLLQLADSFCRGERS